MDQATGDIVFTWLTGGDADEKQKRDENEVAKQRKYPKVVRAPVQVIGTFDALTSTWLWAWDNASIDDRLKKMSLILKQFGEEHGIEQLTIPKWEAENEYEAWKMLAVALRISKSARGTYRGPVDDGTTMIFMTFGDVTIRNISADGDG